MGILRVYLALCVVAAHSGTVFPWRMHDGRQAVQIFYMISGFYMAMVLSSRYGTVRDFYVSRVFRIFPPYWFALLGTVVASLIAGVFFQKWLVLEPYIVHPFECNGMLGVVTAATSNFTIIGQDWIYFIRHDLNGNMRFTENFWTNSSPLWKYLVLPQCWSISIELFFYAIAPFLNRLNSCLLTITAAGMIIARLFFYFWLDLAHDPWTYRFFPFEISLFIFGMLGYRLHERVSWRCLIGKFGFLSKCGYLEKSAVVLLLLYVNISSLNFISKFTGVEFATLLLYPLWILILPILFIGFGMQKEDRGLGELSFPIYLVHQTVIVFVIPLMKHFSIGHGIGIVSATLSVGIAIIFYRLLIRPLEKKRRLLSRGL